MVIEVIFPPCIILSLTGFQIGVPAGASNAWPRFQVFSLSGPWLTAPGGAILSAWLSTPALAANGYSFCADAAASSCASARPAAMISAAHDAAKIVVNFICVLSPIIWADYLGRQIALF